MEIARYIQFDRDERSRINAALASIHIAYREWDEREKVTMEAQRALGSMVAGNDIDSQRLTTGLLALEALAAQCNIEQDVTFWRRQMAEPKPPHEEIVEGRVRFGGIPMVLDPDKLAETIASIREMQLEEAEIAYAILVKARRLLDREETRA